MCARYAVLVIVTGVVVIGARLVCAQPATEITVDALVGRALADNPHLKAGRPGGPPQPRRHRRSADGEPRRAAPRAQPRRPGRVTLARRGPAARRGQPLGGESADAGEPGGDRDAPAESACRHDARRATRPARGVAPGTASN